MHTNLDILDITTRIVGGLFMFIRRNDDVILREFAENNRVPDCRSTKCVRIIDTTFVRQSQGKGNQTHFIFKTVNQANVLNVVVNKLLMVCMIQVIESAFILKFVFTKHYIRNVVEFV